MIAEAAAFCCVDKPCVGGSQATGTVYAAEPWCLDDSLASARVSSVGAVAKETEDSCESGPLQFSIGCAVLLHYAKAIVALDVPPMVWLRHLPWHHVESQFVQPH